MRKRRIISKIFRIAPVFLMRVALPVVMVLALAVTLLPISTPTAEAAGSGGAPCFSTVPIPKIGAAGSYVMTPNTDVGPIAVSPNGTVLLTATNITTSPINDLMKSTDGGCTWILQTNFRTTAGADISQIVDIGLSPVFSGNTTLFVATEKYVYQSIDSGTTFTAMDQPAGWAGGEVITDMDISLDANGRHSVIIGTTAATNTGEVYVYAPATTGLSWQAQRVDGSPSNAPTKTRSVLTVAFSPNSPLMKASLP
jgi:hypothetical protein